MINIYTVLALYFMAAVFYVLEYLNTKSYYEHALAKISLSASHFKITAVRCLWLARLFLISAVVMCVIEQLTYIADPY